MEVGGRRGGLWGVNRCGAGFEGGLRRVEEG